MVVLTLEGDRISAVTRFVDASTMRPFGLPEALEDPSMLEDPSFG
jgi:hypothetical protein